MSNLLMTRWSYPTLLLRHGAQRGRDLRLVSQQSCSNVCARKARSDSHSPRTLPQRVPSDSHPLRLVEAPFGLNRASRPSPPRRRRIFDFGGCGPGIWTSDLPQLKDGIGGGSELLVIPGAMRRRSRRPLPPRPAKVSRGTHVAREPAALTSRRWRPGCETLLKGGCLPLAPIGKGDGFWIGLQHVELPSAPRVAGVGVW